MEFLTQPYMMAFWFGALTAASLPLGAMLGIWLKPSTKIVAALMAFGAGNLLSALTLELIEPSFIHTGFWPISIGCILGGTVFVLLNQLLDKMGGYMRKASTLVSHIKAKKRSEMQDMIEKLSQVDILRSLPPQEIHHIAPSVADRSFKKGDIIFRQGDVGTRLYLIESGTVKIERKGNGDKEVTISELGPGETFGEMALLWKEPRTATVTAASDVLLLEIHRDDFEKILKASPSLRADVEKLADQRKKGLAAAAVLSPEEWKREAIQRLHEEDTRPSSVEMEQALKEGHAGGGAALSMWLGIFLDGIPESLVIGASMIGKAVSPALVGGLFFANLPEAMSSGAMMKKQGKSTSSIFWMWMSLCVMTGVGALLGNILFVGLSPSIHSLFGGLAAGAMLAMIAQTMLPEAYEHGGWLVGILTVFGFLSALMFRAIGHAMSAAEHHGSLIQSLLQTLGA
ncbi:MAG TPA: cyclic nucleotide-binding domain-containing protein [bacterium]|nr:cyclic nucleotide-binding domain-containing protein [bacterium]